MRRGSHRFFAIAYEFEMRIILETAFQTLSDHRMVIDNHDPKCTPHRSRHWVPVFIEHTATTLGIGL